jgi:membrane-associated phospholipid phosphatase
VSALTCYRVHRRLGIAAMICASLVGLSTLFTKQHYIIDVIGGVLLACAAYALFLRSYRRDDVPELDRRLAPVLALGIIAILGIALACCWVAFELSGSA